MTSMIAGNGWISRVCIGNVAVNAEKLGHRNSVTGEIEPEIPDATFSIGSPSNDPKLLAR